MARADAAELREAALLANNEAERQTLLRHNARHAAQVAELRVALEFYADLSAEGPWHLPSDDFGKRARAVLAKGGA